jgi:hypothetical protein
MALSGPLLLIRAAAPPPDNDAFAGPPAPVPASSIVAGPIRGNRPWRRA